MTSLGRAPRKAATRIAQALGRPTRRSSTSAAPPPAGPRPLVVPDDHVVVPRGRAVRFATEEYDIVPKGRYDIVERNYYSPVPHLELLPDDIFDRRSELRGMDLQGGRAMDVVEAELAQYVGEIAEVPTDGPLPPGQFFLRNQNYESVDAELLYAAMRAWRPGRVVELGSGYTTLLIHRALQRNAAEGDAAGHVAYDPYPRQFIVGPDGPDGVRFEPLGATDVPLGVFEQLEAGDVLFVDTTHTVKLGSDVNHIVLDVLPRLRPGVLVHFHDIFLPFEYPRAWFTEFQYLWAEQYLLQAFLAFNSAFEVVLPAQLLARDFPERLGAVVPSFVPGVNPGAVWLRRL